MTRPIDPMLAEVLSRLDSTPIGTIALKSGLSASTIRNWRSGHTKHPQSISIQFALKAVGLRLVIQKA